MDFYCYMYRATILEDNCEEAPRAGVVMAVDMKDAFTQVYDYYGEDLLALAFEDIGAYGKPLKVNPNKYDTLKNLILEENSL